MTDNATFMKMAREDLKGQWGLAIGAFLIAVLILSAVEIVPFVRYFAFIFLSGPIALGTATFALALSRKKNADIKQIFVGFENFVTPFVTYLLMILRILVWTLVLVVPGIIAALPNIAQQ
jgi:uncharacterized membrane protein